MQSFRGYYALVQYCPDASRLEVVNVGVILSCPELKFIDGKVAGSNRRVARVFGRSSFNAQQLRTAKLAIVNRIKTQATELVDPVALEQFARTRANEIILTAPRPIRVSDPAMELDNLFTELVGGRPTLHRELLPDLVRIDEMFRAPDLGRIMRYDERVTVPVLGRSIEVPYAYRNGQLNLIKPHVFSVTESDAASAAMRLAVEGDLLHRHPVNNEARQLIVVSLFKGPGSDSQRVVENLLGEYKVRCVDAQAVPGLLDEVRREVH